jgi:LytS/YehU family sensor histidine kinase
MLLEFGLIINVIHNIALIGIGAYLITRIAVVRRTVIHSRYTLRDKLILGLIFGGFSALGSWIGIPILGALANHRIVGPVVGGLMGGRIVGVCAGLLGAIPRYFFGGFNMWSAIFANVLVGYISGMICERYGIRKFNLLLAMYTTLLAEAVLKGMTLTLSKPFAAAWQLEQVIAIPTTVANTLAVVFFVYIVRDIFREQEKVQAFSAQQSLRMIKKTSAFLFTGLNKDTASQIARIIFKETDAAAVSVTDNKKVLAFIGEGADHHYAGTPIVTAVTKRVMQNLQAVLVASKTEIGCPNNNCRLTAVVDAPLVVGGELVGTIKLYKANNELISSFEEELIQGIAEFFSLLLAQRKLDEKQRLLLQTEYNMLKAQVNPHFFFNTLGTIQALVQVEPQKANTLIKDVADFFRRTLKHGGEFVTLREELETVYNYIRIEKIRFGDRLAVELSIPDELQESLVPVFSIQPLVENCIRHGLSPKKGGGMIQISAWCYDGVLYIKIQDDGLGIPEEKVREIKNAKLSVSSAAGTGIGLINVQRRIQTLYGSKYGLNIESKQEIGTAVEIILPRNVQKEAII